MGVMLARGNSNNRCGRLDDKKGGEEMDGQMTIYDFLSKPEPKPKEIGASCEGCKYKIWLHKGGRGEQSCDRYGGCEYTPRGWTYNRDGTKTEAFSWMKSERCETCRYWDIFPVEQQPPAGWGVKGQCNYYHDPEMITNGYWVVNSMSYCQDYEEVQA